MAKCAHTWACPHIPQKAGTHRYINMCNGYIQIHANMDTYKCTDIQIHTHVRTPKNKCTHTGTNAHTGMHTHIYSCGHTLMHTQSHILTHKLTDVAHTYVTMYIHTDVHTNAHRHLTHTHSCAHLHTNLCAHTFSHACLHTH